MIEQCGMIRRLAFLIIICLFLGSINIMLRIQNVRAVGTIYIKPDGTILPPTQLIQQNGNIYTLTSNITSDADGIIIQKNNMTLNGAGHVLQGSSIGIGISLDEANNVTIENMEIKAFRDGISLYGSLNNNISRINITANERFGIALSLSSNNSIVGNNIIQGDSYGVYFDTSANNSIVGNSIINFNDGIGLYSSSNSNITNNNITANRYGIRVETSNNNIISENRLTEVGLFASTSYGNVVERNSVNNKPLVYLEGLANYTVDDAGQVILVNCDDIRVENLNLSNTTVGLELWETQNCKLKNNTIRNNWCGVIFVSSSNNSIVENAITDSDWYGIRFDVSSNNSLIRNHIANHYTGVNFDFSSNNSITGNNVTANKHWGITLHESSSNSVFCNNITENKDDDGVSLYAYSNYNNISGNYISANYLNGIRLYFSSGNNITGNNITANQQYGIWFYESSNNTIFHNNFVDNTFQVYTYNSTNFWDDGYPSGGNYWSDYEQRYFNASEIDDSGIWDTPYEIDANNQDNYPLMEIIPEFPAFFLLPLFIIMTLLAVLIYRKNGS